ncbi:MAG TPA: hypothetical protein VNO50_00715 [Pyrinomonadaceae bacterium]|nr:hypothetical protein [Pyrinomonadaceae bacterium]
MHRGPVALSAALLILIVLVWPTGAAQAHGDCKSHASLVRISNDSLYAAGNFICSAPRHALLKLTVSLWRCNSDACSTTTADIVRIKGFQCEECKSMASSFTVDCPGDGTYRTVVKGYAFNKTGGLAESDTGSIKKRINC